MTNEKNKRTIESAKIVQEAAEIATRNGLAENADFKGISVDTASIFNQTIVGRQDEYPCIGTLGYIGNNATHVNLSMPSTQEWIKSELLRLNPHLIHDTQSFIQAYNREIARAKRAMSLDAETIAGYFDGKKYGVRGIKVHAKNIEDLDKLQRYVDSGFHPVGTASKKATIDHEIGHALHDSLNLADHEELNALYRTHIKNGTMSIGLSRYVTNSSRSSWKLGYHEFIAEAFSEYKNNPNPRPLAMQVGKIIDEENRKWTEKNTKG